MTHEPQSRIILTDIPDRYLPEVIGVVTHAKNNPDFKNDMVVTCGPDPLVRGDPKRCYHIRRLKTGTITVWLNTVHAIKSGDQP